MCPMGSRSPVSPLRHSRWDSAAAAALGGPVVAGDDGHATGTDRRAGYRAGPGVASPPGETPTGTSDAGAPARPAASVTTADLLTPQAVADGFMVEWVGDQLRLSHHCRNVARIEDPTTALVGWYMRTHRCGSADSSWHIGATPQQRRRDPRTPAHLARSREGRA